MWILLFPSILLVGSCGCFIFWLISASFSSFEWDPLEGSRERRRQRKRLTKMSSLLLHYRLSPSPWIGGMSSPRGLLVQTIFFLFFASLRTLPLLYYLLILFSPLLFCWICALSLLFVSFCLLGLSTEFSSVWWGFWTAVECSVR